MPELTTGIPTNALISAVDPRDGTPTGSGVLNGFQAVIKDMIDVRGSVTTRGAAIYDPAPVGTSAECVGALQAAGAQIIAKANQDEFAWGVTGDNPHWGRIENPRYPALTAGGSSGGTAAAIAAGLARIGLGTDTAGSVRMPAACCGIVGLRPRVGTISSVGVFPLAPSFDTVGPMAATVADCAAAWEALTGERPQPYDSFTGLRIGVFAADLLTYSLDLPGAQLVPVETPAGLLDDFWTVMRAEAFRTHRANLSLSPELFGPGVRAKLELASRVDADDERYARSRLLAHRRAFAERLAGLDAIFAPTLGRSAPSIDAEESDVREAMGWIVATFSALNLPALAIGNLQIAALSESHVLGLGLLWEREIEEVPPPW